MTNMTKDYIKFVWRFLSKYFVDIVPEWHWNMKVMVSGFLLKLNVLPISKEFSCGWWVHIMIISYTQSVLQVVVTFEWLGILKLSLFHDRLGPVEHMVRVFTGGMRQITGLTILKWMPLSAGTYSFAKYLFLKKLK